MTYLVDANILSEATKPRPDSKVVAWLRANEGDLLVDAVILGELALGILGLPRGRKRRSSSGGSSSSRTGLIVCRGIHRPAGGGLNWSRT